MFDNHLQLDLDGNSLTPQQALDVLEADLISARLAPEVIPAMLRTREGGLEAMAAADSVYGWDHGLGHLKGLCVVGGRRFQRSVLLATAAGIGPNLPDRVVRLSMILKANQYARGRAGVRPVLAERYLDLVNVGVLPCMPGIGSLGVGDLQPQAAAGLVLIGELAPARFMGREDLAPRVLAAAGLPVNFDLETGEALSIISGSTVVAAYFIDLIRRAAEMADLAEGAFALEMEATRSMYETLDPRTHSEGNSIYLEEVARRLRALTVGSEWMTTGGRLRISEPVARVVDALSIRGAPQAMHQIRCTIQQGLDLFRGEANCSAFSPLVFESAAGGYEFVPGGNWSSAPMARQADTLNADVVALAVLSQEQSARLLSEEWSNGLPRSLAGAVPGLNSGFTHAMTDATALIPEMQGGAVPLSVLSRPAKFGQEDYNPNGMASMRALDANLGRMEMVLGVQCLLAAQGVGLIADRMGGLSLGAGTQRIYDLIRSRIPVVRDDVYMSPLVNEAIEMVRGRALLRAIRESHPEPVRML